MEREEGKRRKKGKMIGGGIITLLLIGYIFCLPRQLFHVPYSTVVTDRNNELLGARIALDGQWRFPPRTTTPAKIQACFIEFEDNHFFTIGELTQCQ